MKTMDRKFVIIIFVAFIFLAILGSLHYFMKSQEKFVGDISIDSGFYKVDRAMGGSGILSDPIDQS